ncbi:ArsR/SmtB family transcription factor [Bacillus stercoris]|uniref:ArsR family transcriptional regulator n=1 Tax=Bacillus stercoris TaxID=2054641 RepID=A0ABU0VBR9_9BACI|nr:ArsR family transcriptional regulator [Bacillus stercoris]MDQ1853999.1 ArsR family transcriptional regulator [Bacillus stercoris]
MEKSNKNLNKDLLSNGFDKVISKLLTGYEIPEQFPFKQTKSIRFYPSIYVSPKFIVIWELGELNIVYDAYRYSGEEFQNSYNEQKIEEAKSLEKLSDIGKSLSELVRLKILSLISNNSKIKSQEIANELNIATATVSRHLSLLKQNNLVLEKRKMDLIFIL